MIGEWPPPPAAVSRPGSPRRGLSHHPERLQELWSGPRKGLLLLDHASPPEPFLQDATPAWGSEKLLDFGGGRVGLKSEIILNL